MRFINKSITVLHGGVRWGEISACVADMLEALWFEVTSIMMPHGTVSPTDDVVRLMLPKVWVPLLGRKVSDMSVTLGADILEAVFADPRLIIIGTKPVEPAGHVAGSC